MKRTSYIQWMLSGRGVPDSHYVMQRWLRREIRPLLLEIWGLGMGFFGLILLFALSLVTEDPIRFAFLILVAVGWIALDKASNFVSGVESLKRILNFAKGEDVHFAALSEFKLKERVMEERRRSMRVIRDLDEKKRNALDIPSIEPNVSRFLSQHKELVSWDLLEGDHNNPATFARELDDGVVAAQKPAEK